MPAAEPEVADAADPSAPSAHKSILKKTPSARAPSPTEEHEAEDPFDALFGALLPADATVALVVADWRAKHAADPEGALAELYTLIARVRLAFAPRFPADTPIRPRAPRRATFEIHAVSLSFPSFVLTHYVDSLPSLTIAPGWRVRHHAEQGRAGREHRRRDRRARGFRDGGRERVRG
jgi:hypothetical protein